MNINNKYITPTTKALVWRPFSKTTWVSQYQSVSFLHFTGATDDGGGGDNWSYKTRKAPVKSLQSTNQHPVEYITSRINDTGRIYLCALYSPNLAVQHNNHNVFSYTYRMRPMYHTTPYRFILVCLCLTAFSVHIGYIVP